MRRIAVLTSGGDAPGMNAAIRAVVRQAVAAGWEAFGVLHGFQGLLDDEMRPLGPRDVGGIIQLGGTVLGSARCEEFRRPDGCTRAAAVLAARGIEGLIVIGGNGSQSGAAALARTGYPVVGVASTIDNDLLGSDITIGVDTALNVGLEALDRLRVTASSHNRAVLVEVMGRQCGYLALQLGITGGAEAIVIPEAEIEPAEVADMLQRAFDRGKAHALVVVAEGARNNAARLVPFFRLNRQRFGFELRATILGHVQRGGTPTHFDRLLGTRLGTAAVHCLARGEAGVLVGLTGREVTATPLADIAGRTKAPDLSFLEMARVLAQ
ncbi:MAG TPA: ATP-dependent 6-phosphofructokinase [Candidatus Limnocylindria bacterium]|nr:ATP-dependent 6-phosphofructokinase [Candidatus Limnocylindria bacterium]